MEKLTDLLEVARAEVEARGWSWERLELGVAGAGVAGKSRPVGWL